MFDCVGAPLDLSHTGQFHCDCMTNDRLGRLLRHALFLQPGAVFWAAPPCCSWIWLARSKTHRIAKRGWGNRKYDKVVYANRLVSRLCVVLLLLTLRGVMWTVETPGNSLLFRHSWLRLMFDFVGNLLKVSYCELGAYGASTTKPIVLVGTAPYIEHINRRATGQLRRQLAQNTEDVVVKHGPW